MTDRNGPQSRPEARRALSRWEEVIFPSYRIIPRSERSQRLAPRWLERQQASEQAKDLTGQIRGEK